MRFVRVGFVGISTGVLAVGAQLAYGQTSPSLPAAKASDEAPLDEVLITGSRIMRSDYTSDSPLLTVTPELLTQTPSITVEQTLNLLPQFVGSYGANTASPGKNGEATLNLRGLGSNRTLILLDGRRLQPSSPSGEVDVNSLPIQLISGVEIMTGGASATYGSDAVAGVVNFKTRDLYEGGKADLKYGFTDESDGRNRQLALTYGSKLFDSRASAVLSVQYSDRDRIPFGARDWFPKFVNQAGGLPVINTASSGGAPYGQFSFASNPPTQAAINSIFAQYGVAAGSVRNTEIFGVNPDGTLFNNTPVTHPIYNYRGQLNQDYQFYNNTLVFALGPYVNLTNGMKSSSEFGRFTFDFTDHIKAYSQVYFDQYTVNYNGNPRVALGANGGQNSTPVTNPFIPPDLATLLASRANPTAPFTIVEGLGLPFYIKRSYRYDVLQGLAGVGGDFPSLAGWTWDIYASTGRNRLNTDVDGTANGSAVRALLTAPDGGASLCTGGFNPFGDAPISQSCYEYMVHSSTDRTQLKQNNVEASIQGGLFALPAGDLKFAAGLQYRRNTYTFTPSPTAGDRIGTFGSAFTSTGEQTTNEAYVEFLVPVLKELPLIHSLDLDLAYRYSDYNTFGGSSTYHANLDWGITAPLHVRGGYSRAIRAPALGELYASPTNAFVTIGSAANGSTQGDPCDFRSAARIGPNGAAVAALCTAQGVPGIATYVPPNTAATGVNAGNPDLQAEGADTYTAGIVWRSSNRAGLSASLDYWSIKIGNAIGVVPLTVTLSRCFNYDGSNPTYDPANFYCSLIHRDSPGVIGSLNGTSEQPLLNQAAMKTSGVDLALDYRFTLADLHASLPGTLSVNFVGTRLQDLQIQAIASAATLDYAGTTGNGQIDGASLPKNKTVTTLNYSVGSVTTGVRWRYLSRLRDKSVLTTPTSTVRGVGSYNYIDLLGTVGIGSTNIGFGISNLLNKQPPIVGGVAGTTDLATYDPVGRAYFLSAGIDF